MPDDAWPAPDPGESSFWDADPPTRPPRTNRREPDRPVGPDGRPPVVTGLELGERIGSGGCGEVWAATEVATGRRLAVKRLTGLGAHVEAAAELVRREAALLAAVAGPHVVAAERVDVTGGEAVLVMALAEGGSLADLLAARGTLGPAEAVTVLAPVARALSALHGHGLAHGDVSPANLLFSADGRPMVSDVGLARVVGSGGIVVAATPGFTAPEVEAGERPTAASDVWALGAVGLAVLTGAPATDPADAVAELEAWHRAVTADLPAVAAAPLDALAAALTAALAPDPHARPEAQQLSEDLLVAHPAAPVRLLRTHTAADTRTRERHGPPVAVTPPSPVARRRRPHRERSGSATRPARGASGRRAGRPRLRPVVPRRLGLGLVALTGLVLATVAGVRWGHAGGAGAARLATAPQAAPAGAAARTDWRTVVVGLSDARDRALSSGSGQRLLAVYASGSPALQADRATIASLAGRGDRVVGLRTAVGTAVAHEQTSTSAVVTATETVSSYRVVDGHGTVVGLGRAAPPHRVTLHLVRQAQGWRVSTVSDA